jgi:murein L,D-transpeptidase YcbB/YkuD
MNPLVLVAAAGALLFLFSGGAKASASDAPPAAKPKPKPPTAAAKPKPRTRKEGAPAAQAMPKPRPSGSPDDLQALVDEADSGVSVSIGPATNIRPVDGPIVDVEVPVNYVGPTQNAPAPPPAAQPAFDQSKARRLAPPLAKHITAKKYDYARQSVTDFQRAAGLKPDGIYGPKTASALRFYNGTAPKALFKGPAEEYAVPN